MSLANYNAISYANKLKQAGLKSNVADVQAEEMANFINDTLATKEDLTKLELKMQAFIVKSLITLTSVLIGFETLLNYMK